MACPASRRRKSIAAIHPAMSFITLPALSRPVFFLASMTQLCDPFAQPCALVLGHVYGELFGLLPVLLYTQSNLLLRGLPRLQHARVRATRGHHKGKRLEAASRLLRIRTSAVMQATVCGTAA